MRNFARNSLRLGFPEQELGDIHIMTWRTQLLSDSCAIYDADGVDLYVLHTQPVQHVKAIELSASSLQCPTRRT